MSKGSNSSMMFLRPGLSRCRLCISFRRQSSSLQEYSSVEFSTPRKTLSATYFGELGELAFNQRRTDRVSRNVPTSEPGQRPTRPWRIYPSRGVRVLDFMGQAPHDATPQAKCKHQ